MNYESLYRVFYSLFPASSDQATVESLWLELIACYSTPVRCYHTAKHIRQVIQSLLLSGQHYEDRNALLLAAFYHDVIYDPVRPDNEAQSAAFARERLLRCGVPNASIERCCAHILATATHCNSSDPDTRSLLDADLRILGQRAGAYRVYAAAVRAEYGHLTDATYYKGRLRVLRNFVSRRSIYQTPWFVMRHEETARLNLGREIDEIGKRLASLSQAQN